jgi:hypothetical protein
MGVLAPAQPPIDIGATVWKGRQQFEKKFRLNLFLFLGNSKILGFQSKQISGDSPYPPLYALVGEDFHKFS